MPASFSLKPGARVHESYAMAVALLVVTDVYFDHDCSVVITSGRDGQHKPGSLHPKGMALDFRRYSSADMDEIAHSIASRLGPDYQVILESDHLHIEFDPREK